MESNIFPSMETKMEMQTYSFVLLWLSTLIVYLARGFLLDIIACGSFCCFFPDFFLVVSRVFVKIQSNLIQGIIKFIHAKNHSLKELRIIGFSIFRTFHGQVSRGTSIIWICSTSKRFKITCVYIANRVLQWCFRHSCSLPSKVIEVIDEINDNNDGDDNNTTTPTPTPILTASKTKSKHIV